MIFEHCKLPRRVKKSQKFETRVKFSLVERELFKFLFSESIPTTCHFSSILAISGAPLMEDVELMHRTITEPALKLRLKFLNDFQFGGNGHTYFEPQLYASKGVTSRDLIIFVSLALLM